MSWFMVNSCKNHNKSVSSGRNVDVSHWCLWVAVRTVTHTHTQTHKHSCVLINQRCHLKSAQLFRPKFEFSQLKTDHSLLDSAPFVTTCYFKMTFSPVLWTDALMMHEMCRLAVLVLFQCSVPPPPPTHTLKIGHRGLYVIFMRLELSIQRGPFILFTWERVSKCQLQRFIFHVRIEMSQPSITPALIRCRWEKKIKYIYIYIYIFDKIQIICVGSICVNCLRKWASPHLTSSGLGTDAQIIFAHLRN